VNKLINHRPEPKNEQLNPGQAFIRHGQLYICVARHHNDDAIQAVNPQNGAYLQFRSPSNDPMIECVDLEIHVHPTGTLT
jgi:hypothetical protein